MTKSILKRIKTQFETRKREVDVDSIKEYDKNNKEHGPDQIKMIADSIMKFGFTAPIVIDSNGVLIVGHGRFVAAKSLGIKTLPALIIDDLTEEEIREYRILDNRVTDMSIRDRENLVAELAEIENVGLKSMFVNFGFLQTDLGEELASDLGGANIDDTHEVNVINDYNDAEGQEGIKRVDLNFTDEQYIKILEVFEKILIKSNGKLESISDVFIEKIDYLYNNLSDE